MATVAKITERRCTEENYKGNVKDCRGKN